MSHGNPALQTGAPVIVTKLFATTFAVTFIAYFVAYLPFLVKLSEAKLQKNVSLLEGFANNIEELFVAGLAVSLAAFLTYYESEREKLYGNNCATFAFANILSVIICIMCFFLCHNPSNHVEVMIAAEPAVAGLAAFTNFLTLMFAFLTVLQIRRAKDGYA
jgi:hypothetical protein